MKIYNPVLLSVILVIATLTPTAFAGNKNAVNGTDGTSNSGTTWTGDFGKARNSIWPKEYIDVLDRGTSMAFTISDRNGIVKVCNTADPNIMTLGRAVNSDGSGKLTIYVDSAFGGTCLSIENRKSSVLELSLQ